MRPDDRYDERKRMVREQILARGIRDRRLLGAFLRVPRHRFLPAEVALHAYEDRALPIGPHQTISQPFMVARMLELLEPRRGDRVLEVGTGLGYQAALLAELTRREVHTMERIGSLARGARERLRDAGYPQVQVIHGDGHLGLPDHAPYDVIVVAAGAAQVPPALEAQLAEGGRLAAPIGEGFHMEVTLIRREGDRLVETRCEPCLFVPLLEGVEEG